MTIDEMAARTIVQRGADGSLHITCPACGSDTDAHEHWVGGKGQTLILRCTMNRAPLDDVNVTGLRWCGWGIDMFSPDYIHFLRLALSRMETSDPFLRLAFSHMETAGA